MRLTVPRMMPLCMSFIMSLSMSFIMTLLHRAPGVGLVTQWLSGWIVAWPIAAVLASILAPQVFRLLSRRFPMN
ncbi:hypothetical protein CBF45_07790 [Bordetella sp. J329]|uniref:DUF2798 domain-containing protein n=1 Tax=Kerstersia gyiorum TaxID=206506 RepID=UPI000FD8AC91|nr:hypothetical protein CBF45_07790 [Bordetella sp. J329]